MKNLFILVVELGHHYGLMAIFGVVILAFLLICLNRYTDWSIKKTGTKLLSTFERLIEVHAAALEKQELIVDDFFKRLEEEKGITPKEIKEFSIEIALCPASFFEYRKEDHYRSLNEKIAKFLDGKYEQFFLGKKKHSKRETEKIVDTNAEQLEKIITRELYPV
jgi:hypothetical protein